MIVNNIEIFKLVVVLKPGDAWFEANLNIVNNIIRVHGNPYRLSPYGNQSICMKDPILVNYCFCKLYWLAINSVNREYNVINMS